MKKPILAVLPEEVVNLKDAPIRPPVSGDHQQELRAELRTQELGERESVPALERAVKLVASNRPDSGDASAKRPIESVSET